MEWPDLKRLAPNAFPEDVIARAAELQEEIGSIGAYSHSQGVPLIRQNVAKFIQGELLDLTATSLECLCAAFRVTRPTRVFLKSLRSQLCALAYMPLLQGHFWMECQHST